MKNSTLISLLFFLSLSTAIFSQTQKLICDITSSPMHGEYIVTAGTVSSIVGDEWFLSQGGCSIKCEGSSSNVPSNGQFIVVIGSVEIDDLEIDVQSWHTTNTPPGPPDPDPVVTTVAGALSATPGTVVLLTGNVSSWTDMSDGEGIFTDGANNINIDFEAGNIPTIGVQIEVLGTIDFEDGQNEINVYYWYPEGGNPPPPQPLIVWNANDASNAPVGSYAVIAGIVTSWTNMGDGEGIYNDGTSTINVDFEDGVSLPQLSVLITIFGLVEIDNAEKEIQVYLWELGDLLNITEINPPHSIILYPIPTLNQLFIRADLNIDSIQIFDITGKMILSINSSSINMIDISELVSGTYAIRLFSYEELIGSQLIIKQ